MYVIDAEFFDLHDLSLGRCLGEIGVYALWSEGANARPSYVGEGFVVDRISKHLQDVTKPFSTRKVIEGAVALCLDGPEKKRKSDAVVVERTLLEAALQLGIFPSHNKAPGKLAAVYKRGLSHDMIRVNIHGRHPLRLRSRVNGTARIDWRWNDWEGWQLEGLPWRR